MKKLIALFMSLMLCLTVIPALSEDTVTSPEFDPGITMSLPDPGWKVSIRCAQANQTLSVGTTVALTAEITSEQPDYYNLSNYNVSYNWQAKAPGGDWTSVCNGDTYEFNLNADNVNWVFKVTVTLTK